MASLEAAHCWHWCDGWAPERWPAYDALHDVGDWQQLHELMAHMRDKTRGNS